VLIEYYDKNFWGVDKAELLHELERRYKKILRLRKRRYMKLDGQILKIKDLPDSELAVIFDLNYTLVKLNSMINQLRK
jgi:hypothetical protein